MTFCLIFWTIYIIFFFYCLSIWLFIPWLWLSSKSTVFLSVLFAVFISVTALIAGSGSITVLSGCDDTHYRLNITTVSRPAWRGLQGVTASSTEGSHTWKHTHTQHFLYKQTRLWKQTEEFVVKMFTDGDAGKDLSHIHTHTHTSHPSWHQTWHKHTPVLPVFTLPIIRTFLPLTYRFKSLTHGSTQKQITADD